MQRDLKQTCSKVGLGSFPSWLKKRHPACFLHEYIELFEAQLVCAIGRKQEKSKTDEKKSQWGSRESMSYESFQYARVSPKAFFALAFYRIQCNRWFKVMWCFETDLLLVCTRWTSLVERRIQLYSADWIWFKQNQGRKRKKKKTDVELVGLMTRKTERSRTNSK